MNIFEYAFARFKLKVISQHKNPMLLHKVIINQTRIRVHCNALFLGILFSQKVLLVEFEEDYPDKS